MQLNKRYVCNKMHHPSHRTTSFQRRGNVFDVQITFHQRQNDVVCLMGSSSVKAFMLHSMFDYGDSKEFNSDP